MMLAGGLLQAIVNAVKGQTFFSGFCREYVDRRFGLMWSIALSPTYLPPYSLFPLKMSQMFPSGPSPRFDIWFYLPVGVS